MADYCLIGEKLGHSFSKIIHEKMGYEYDLVEVEKDKLQDFVNAKKYKAYNVTIPYKQVIMPMLDVIDESAKLIGSVNTVVNRDGVLYGYNTDIYGMEYAFEKAGIVLKDKKVIILGSGGTYATATALCKMKGAKEEIKVSRNGENTYDNISKHYDAEVIINTTPVGMYPHNEDQLISIKPFTKLTGLFDAIYNPLKTKILLEADEKWGDKYHCNGLAMLVAQAKFARDLFFGNKIDNSIIEKIIKEIENDKLNIVLIGMPGCGKSTIGKELANSLNKTFVDIDSEIIQKAGKTIPEIFKEEGEKAFRDIEEECILEISKKQGLVIATGGGAILRENNVTALKGNGLVIFLDRDADKLASDGRPLSSSKEAIQNLYNNRIELYKKAAKYIVDDNGTINEVVDTILDLIK